MAARAKRRTSASAKARGGRRDRASGRLDPFAARRDRYAPMLEVLDLAEAFAAMPRFFQEFMWRRKLPDPVVRFDASVPAASPDRRTLARDIERNIHAATFEVDGRKLLVRDHYTIIPALTLVARYTPLDGKLPESVETFIRLAGERCPAFFEAQQKPATWALYQAIHAPIVAHSRHDTRLYISLFTADPTAAGDKFQPVITLRAHEPEVRRVRLEKGERPVYRVAGPVAADNSGPEWLSAPASALPPRRDPAHGASRPRVSDAPLPVYVQAHALRQLRRRLNHGPAAPYVEAWLVDSLREPIGIERQPDGDWLVAYVLDGKRLGYLVVTPLPDMLLVRTFLFLTMEGTPEARALRRELKLSRRDLDWLGLADLAAFTQTDLRHDRDLRKLFRKCGCDHLFKLDELADAPAPRQLAAEVKRYLRLAA